MVKKIKPEFKTRMSNGRRLMICRASEPTDKYFSRVPCTNYSVVSKDTDAILCGSCVQKLLKV